MLKIFSPIVGVANNGEEKFTSFHVLLLDIFKSAT